MLTHIPFCRQYTAGTDLYKSYHLSCTQSRILATVNCLANLSRYYQTNSLSSHDRPLKWDLSSATCTYSQPNNSFQADASTNRYSCGVDIRFLPNQMVQIDGKTKQKYPCNTDKSLRCRYGALPSFPFFHNRDEATAAASSAESLCQFLLTAYLAPRGGNVLVECRGILFIIDNLCWC